MVLLHKLKKLDGFTLFVMLCLNAIGTIAVYTATVGTRFEGIHIIGIVLFCVFCIPMLLAAVLDYGLFISKFSYYLYGIGIILLVIVKFKGKDVNGAVRWLSLGPFQLQPSELVKLFTILLATHVLNKRAREKMRFFQDILPIIVIFLIPILLIIDQPDLGTALVFVGILFGMLWIGNIRGLHMAVFIGIIAAIVGAVLWLYYSDNALLAHIIKSHQMARIQTFLDPANDPAKSWQVNNAMNAIKSGGMYGGDGYYVNHGYIPYAYSDSIFSVIGEKYGFFGSSLLLLLYFLLIYRMILVVQASRDLGGSYLVVGLVSMMVFQIWVNIGMHIGLLPLTGIPLPFISYGGTSLLMNMVSVGLVLSVKIHNDEFNENIR